MPGTFLFAIILAVIAILCAGARIPVRRAAAAQAEARSGARTRSASDSDPVPVPGILLAVTVLFGAIAACLTIAASWNPVPTQDIGIVTSFGQPTGHLGAGAHFTAPWDQVTDMDEAVQVTDTTMKVKIAGQQIADATVAIRWQINATASDDIFRNYKNSTSGVENGLLLPELNSAMNTVYDGYDPIAPLATGAAPGTSTNPTTAQLAAQVQSLLSSKVGQDVKVITLVVQPLQYDATVQQRINSVLAQTAKTDVAKQSELTAQAQAKANQIIQQSVANNPLVLVQQCMNAIADGQLNPPAGFSCWPGQGSGVVIPSSTSK
jgi:regulator of protease activity HflC (stomatin/prohibitin superfamily)